MKHDLAAEGHVVVLATHDLEVADRCDDRIDLRDGRQGSTRANA